MFHFSWKRVNEILMKFFLCDFQRWSNFSVWLRTFYQLNFKGTERWLCSNVPFTPSFPHKLLSYEFFLSIAWTTCQHVDDTRFGPNSPSSPLSLYVSFPPAEPSKSSPRRKFDAGRFQSTDLFFHIGIYFFTVRCIEWMKKESRWGIGLPSFFSFSPPFFTFRERIPSDCVFLLKGDDEWLLG